MPGYATVEIVIDSLVFSLALLFGTEQWQGRDIFFSITTKGIVRSCLFGGRGCKEGSAGATQRVCNNLRWGSAK